ncbi:MAG: NnrU family protein [Rhodospirillales bacterium]
MGWLAFAAIFAAFFATHSLPLRPPVKAKLVGVLGRRGFALAYSVLSLVMLAWLIVAAGQAPFVELWEPAAWQRQIALAGLLALCLVMALAIGRPNPLSFGGARNASFDPQRPGMVRWTRHPLLLGLAVWAGLHLLPNGDLAHVVLFGVLLAFALLGMGIVDRRKRRLLGDADWTALRDQVARAPLVQRPASWPETLLRLAAGIAVFLLLVWLHPPVLGVYPLA